MTIRLKVVNHKQTPDLWTNFRNAYHWTDSLDESLAGHRAINVAGSEIEFETEEDRQKFVTRFA